MARIEDFFFEENSVSELSGDRYAHIEMLKRAVDAMANATYQSIYVIDYFKREFLHVASNPLFLGGHTAEQMKKMGYRLEQIQDFTPTPMTIATEMYYTGIDPTTMKPVYVATAPADKADQRRLFFFYKPEERKAIIESLRRTGNQRFIPLLFSHRV